MWAFGTWVVSRLCLSFEDLSRFLSCRLCYNNHYMLPIHSVGAMTFLMMPLSQDPATCLALLIGRQEHVWVCVGPVSLFRLSQMWSHQGDLILQKHRCKCLR